MGPTATGKSDLAIALADRLGCEIISVDSVMVYRGMNIGTAKPDIDQMQGIPHHLIDILDPSESYSTGQFKTHALDLVRLIRKRGKIPLLVGGTMLYFKALLHGLAVLPSADQKIRNQIDEEARLLGWSKMHDQLAEFDPHSAARIHPNDPQRIQRALEVFRVTGKSLTELLNADKQQSSLPNAIKLVVESGDRLQLHRRIADRFTGMIEKGLVEEVEGMFNRGDLTDRHPSVRAVGYRQVWGYLNREYDRQDMVKKSIVATRQLAKRQLTWLRKEPANFRYDYGKSGIFEKILKDVEPLLM